MKGKRILWTLCIILLAATLVYLIELRTDLNSDVIVAGSDNVFVDENAISDAPKESDNGGTNAGAYASLDFPDISITDWKYRIISKNSPNSSYTPTVDPIGDGMPYLDSDTVRPLRRLLQAARDAGYDPYVAAGYISYADQQQLFNAAARKISESEGITFEKAQSEAESVAERPGTSDHQTGLGVDITDKQYETLDYNAMDKSFFDWLDANCADYGFIKRYPVGKESITGRSEPWHYRFVGKEAAQFIMQNGLCLEEFAAHYNS